jgi:protein-tyrosine phosphatase
MASYWERFKTGAAEAQVAARSLAAQASEAAANFSLDHLVDPNLVAQQESAKMDGEITHRVGGLNFTYVRDRLVAMSFPGSGARPTQNRIEHVASVLKERHDGRYMIWNLSEEEYDYQMFDSQVQEFKFPGHPAPPLAVMFQIINSMESWLAADPENIAVVHCLTGRGRTVTVLACFLAWVGEFDTATDALSFVCERRHAEMERVVIPSQIRYVHYFCNVMSGTKPRSEPLLLKRVIVNTIPTFCTPLSKFERERQILQLSDSGTSDAAAKQAALASRVPCDGCCPYLQIFQEGKVLFSSTWGLKEKGETIPQYYKSDGSFSFEANVVLYGDVLVRCRHVDTTTGKRISMFRAGFHTGYIPQLVQRLPRSQCDGAVTDKRFGVDFFVDLIFAPVPADHVMDEKKMLPNKFWNEVAKRKERLRRAHVQQKVSSVATTPTGNKRTIINLHSPMRQQRLAEIAERKERAKRSSSLSMLQVGGNGKGRRNTSGKNVGQSVSAQTPQQGVESDDVQVGVSPRSPKKDAFSLLDEDDDMFDSPSPTMTSTERKSAATDNDMSVDLMQNINHTNDPLAAEADKTVDELALLEAELGFTNAVSSTLRNLGKSTDEKQAEVHLVKKEEATTCTAPLAPSSEALSTAPPTTAPPTTSTTIVAEATAAPSTDLDDFDFDDLSAELEGLGVVDDGGDGLHEGEGDNTSLDDLDDFLAGLES